MTNYSTPSSTPPSFQRPAPPVPPPEKSRSGVTRVVIIATAALIGVLVLLFVLAVILAQVAGDSVASWVQVIRDLVIIFMALEGILIILALSVLVLQVARLVNLLQNEVKPILKDTRDTMQNARGTVTFVSDTVSRPLITASAFFAGVGSLVGNVGGIRTALKKTAEDVREEVEER